MEGNDPDFVVFIFNLRAIIRARALEKYAVLLSNLRLNAADPRSHGESSNNDAQWESRFCVSSHIQSDSDNSPESLTAWSWNISRVYRKEFRRAPAFKFGTVRIPDGDGWPNPIGIFEIAFSPLCTGRIHEPTTVEKIDRCRCIWVRKDTGRNSAPWNVHNRHTGEKFTENWPEERSQFSPEPTSVASTNLWGSVAFTNF